jgi:hypothetical protein
MCARILYIPTIRALQKNTYSGTGEGGKVWGGGEALVPHHFSQY